MSGDRPISVVDRLRARERPDGIPIMRQSWDKVLFLHWQISQDAIRHLMPESLAIDTFDGKAYLTVTPLTIWDMAIKGLPTVPYLGWMHELNVRTYVHRDGVPGIWFFSLDANNLPAVVGARTMFSLPYFNAEIELSTAVDQVSFRSRRTDGGAEFEASWSMGDDVDVAQPESLDFFLVERYCLYAADGDTLYRCRINHQPWPLRPISNVRVSKIEVIPADGIPAPTEQYELVHGGGPVNVDVWPLERID
jgi:uncharacterized protein